jgi:lipoprotein-anchoring transpeptidase ErfK/SrfK
MKQIPDHPLGSTFLTRRDFLRLGATGIVAALGLTLPSQRYLYQLLNQINKYWIKPREPQKYFNLIETLDPEQQGRVLDASIDVYDFPSFSARPVNTYYRDWILPITDITIGTSEDSFNMVWYKVGTEGYMHSGSIQPVLTQINPVVADIPPDGAVAEVTVPFTDARWNPGENELVAYRFYYATTYWIMGLFEDKNGKPWYAVRDDKWEYMYYVPAEHLRLVPHDEMQPISPHIPTQNKRIEVHLPEQVMIAYEFDQPVFMARVATGALFSNGDFSTPNGRYMTFHKRSSRHMARGNLAANGYDLPGVPWNSYITEEGIAFHGTYWHNNFGKPRSHGCINLTPQAAKWVFLWTMPTVPPNQEGIYKEVGTIVDIIG